jgi:hypothetical protein
MDSYFADRYIPRVPLIKRALMRSPIRCAGILAVAATAFASRVSAQEPTPLPGPAVGDVAPDFSLPGATRYGLLKGPVHLGDYRGETVVLAFFYQARTKG